MPSCTAPRTPRTSSACLRRAVTWFAEQGAGPIDAVLSDNAKCYATSHAFRRTLDELGARHILTPPYTPQWTGKLERFWQTLDTEWAHSRQWPNSTTRDRALASYLRFYNRRRPHSACSGRPPPHPRSARPQAEQLARQRQELHRLARGNHVPVPREDGEAVGVRERLRH